MHLLPLVLIAATLLAIAVFWALGWLPGGGNSYQAKNAAIPKTLPVPPGVELVSVEHHPYYAESPPILNKILIGWTLNATYRPPPAMTEADVQRFYEANPPEGWRVEIQETSGIDLMTGQRVSTFSNVVYSQGRATVTVMTGNLQPGAPHTYEVAIDQRFYRVR